MVTRHFWQSAKTLFDAGKVVTGTLGDNEYGARSLIQRLVEAMYSGAFAGVIPESRHPTAEQAEGKRLSERAAAKHFLLSPFQPYERTGQPWSDDAKVATRLDDGARPVRAVEERRPP